MGQLLFRGFDSIRGEAGSRKEELLNITKIGTHWESLYEIDTMPISYSILLRPRARAWPWLGSPLRPHREAMAGRLAGCKISQRLSVSADEIFGISVVSQSVLNILD